MKRSAYVLLIFILLLLPGCASLTPLADKTAQGGKVALYNAGVAALQKGSFAQATDKFNAALALSPSAPELHFLNALTYQLRVAQEGDGLYPLAEQGYALALKFAPSKWYYHLFAGLCKIEQKQYHEAKMILAEGLFLQASDADLLYLFLYASYYDLDVANAVAALQRLQQLEPDSQRTRVAAIILSAARGDLLTARSKLDQLQPLPDSAKLIDQLSLRIDDWDNNLSYYAKQPEQQTSSGTLPQPVAEVPEMIVLDATIIRNEEESYSSSGINLLDGLKIQFGEAGTYDSGAAYGENKTTDISKSYEQDESGAWILSGASKTLTSSVTKAISIPALSYSLNIFNSGNGHSEVMARPTLVAALNQESHFFAGTEINAAVDSNSDSAYSSGTTINLETGVRLTITPDEINSDSVRMKVKLERSFLTAPSTNLVLYDYMVMQSKTEVAANVSIRYGETLMLGGLLEKESTTQKGGTTLLQDIPVVKYLFSNETADVFKRSMLIMLTPYRYNSSGQIEKAALVGEKQHPALARLRQKYPSWYAPVESHFARILKQINAGHNRGVVRSDDLVAPELLTSLQTQLNKVRETE